MPAGKAFINTENTIRRSSTKNFKLCPVSRTKFYHILPFSNVKSSFRTQKSTVALKNRRS